MNALVLGAGRMPGHTISIFCGNKVKAIETERYFRVPVDARDLNYDKYFSEGNNDIAAIEAYTSHNTEILDLEQVKEKLLSIDYVREELAK